MSGIRLRLKPFVIKRPTRTWGALMRALRTRRRSAKIALPKLPTVSRPRAFRSPFSDFVKSFFRRRRSTR